MFNRVFHGAFNKANQFVKVKGMENHITVNQTQVIINNTQNIASTTVGVKFKYLMGVGSIVALSGTLINQLSLNISLPNAPVTTDNNHFTLNERIIVVEDNSMICFNMRCFLDKYTQLVTELIVTIEMLRDTLAHQGNCSRGEGENDKMQLQKMIVYIKAVHFLMKGNGYSFDSHLEGLLDSLFLLIENRDILNQYLFSILNYDSSVFKNLAEYAYQETETKDDLTTYVTNSIKLKKHCHVRFIRWKAQNKYQFNFIVHNINIYDESMDYKTFSKISRMMSYFSKGVYVALMKPKTSISAESQEEKDKSNRIASSNEFHNSDVLLNEIRNMLGGGSCKYYDALCILASDVNLDEVVSPAKLLSCETFAFDEKIATFHYVGRVATFQTSVKSTFQQFLGATNNIMSAAVDNTVNDILYYDAHWKKIPCFFG